jgi:hypothetical protein
VFYVVFRKRAIYQILANHSILFAYNDKAKADFWKTIRLCYRSNGWQKEGGCFLEQYATKMTEEVNNQAVFLHINFWKTKHIW